jgi:hypothetical protein
MYAISRGLDPSRLSSIPGLSGGRLDVVEHRGLVAVVSDVDLTEFGEEGLRQNLERLDWLEEVARGHDSVVQAVASLGPTAPLRLATICLDDGGVRRRLDEWYDALELVLDRVEGRREWSVKAFAAGGDPAGEPADGGEAPKTGGAAYLQRKKAQQRERENRDGEAARLAAELHTAFASASAASRRLPPQDPRLTGHTGTMTLNGAYLVDVDASAEFEATARRLQAEHPEAGIDFRGPWPPYSFAMLEQ